MRSTYYLVKLEKNCSSAVLAGTKSYVSFNNMRFTSQQETFKAVLIKSYRNALDHICLQVMKN